MILLYIILYIKSFSWSLDYLDSSNLACNYKNYEKPPKILKKNSKVAATTRSSISLTCSIIEGDEPITIHWEFVSSATQKVISLDGKGPKLTIDSVQKNHAGKYTCLVENDAGEDEHTIELIVKDGDIGAGAPKIDKHQKVLQTSLGNLLIFTCKLLEGSSNTSIHWKFKGRESDKFKNIKPTFVNVTFIRNKFVIKSVRRKNLGFYKCIAINENGRDDHTFEVTIKVAATKPPVIDKRYKMIQAKEGFPITLNCKIIGGDPATNIQWLYRKRKSKRAKKLKTEGDTFMIGLVKSSYAGIYKCIAKNEAGSDSHLMELIVQESVEQLEGTRDTLKEPERGPPLKGNKPANRKIKVFGSGSSSDSGSGSDSNVFPEPPFIQKYTRWESIREKFPVALFCNLLRGIKGTSIKWRFREETSPHFHDLNITSSPLVMPSVQLWHRGTYRCVAKNEAGRDKLDIILNVLRTRDDGKLIPSHLRLDGTSGELFELSNANIRDRNHLLPVLDCDFQYTCIDIKPICISFREDMTNRKPKILKIEDLCNLQYAQCAENVKAKLMKPKFCGLPDHEYEESDESEKDDDDKDLLLENADYEIRKEEDSRKKCVLARSP